VPCTRTQQTKLPVCSPHFPVNVERQAYGKREVMNNNFWIC